jgi:chromosome segregation ATPase
MKLNIFFVALATLASFGAVVVVQGQEESENNGGGCDCSQQIDEHIRPVLEHRDTLQRDVNTLLEQREQLIRERDELFHSREGVIQERDTLFHQKQELEQNNHNNGATEELQRRLDETSRALEEHRTALADAQVAQHAMEGKVEEYRLNVARAAEDREHFQKVAQENQHYMQEYKIRLATMRDKSAKLDLEVQSAQRKIQELESATLVTKIKKELSAGYDSFLQLIGKHKEDDVPATAEDL